MCLSRRAIILIVAVCGIAMLGSRLRAQKSDPEVRPCKLVEEALEESRQLKPGMTRRQVEKDFEMDGGLQFPSSGTYTYQRCNYIKLDIEFKHIEKSEALLSPDDIITSISQPYIAYPRRD